MAEGTVPGRRHARRATVPRPGRLRGDGGSAAAELVLLTPLLVLMLLLVVAAGRLIQARLEVDSAARQAARAASIASDPATAATAAASTAQLALTGQGITCTRHAITLSASDFRPGGQVTATVSCTVQLAGLSGLHLPATITLTSRFTSPIDVYRSFPAAGSGGTASAGNPGAAP